VKPAGVESRGVGRRSRDLGQGDEPEGFGGGLTGRAADTASPWARRGGWSGEVASPAVVVGRLRRAADAIVRFW